MYNTVTLLCKYSGRLKTVV